MKRSEIRVYVAGAMRNPDSIEYQKNIRRGIRAGVILKLRGYVPYIPHLDPQMILLLREDEHITIEKFLEDDLVWLAQCHAMFLLPGSSKSAGVHGEVKLANKLGIPIFETYAELDNFFKGGKDEGRKVRRNDRHNGVGRHQEMGRGSL